MPLLIDIMENEVLGREFKKGLEEGRAEGLQEGRVKGLQEGLQEGRVEGLQEGVEKGFHQGELAVLLRQINKRFGPVPAWAEQALRQYSVQELEETSVRVLDAHSIGELLRHRPTITEGGT